MHSPLSQFVVIIAMLIGAFLVFADYDTTYNGIPLKDALLSPGLILIGGGLYFFARNLFSRK